MVCPKCGSENIGVIDSRPNRKSMGENVVYRMRKCSDCGKKFQTIEKIYVKERPPDKVVYLKDSMNRDCEYKIEIRRRKR
jgi:transcriptional regulator NrdR family protein